MNLETRQWRLKDWLENHFVSGRFFSVEEIVENVRDSLGRKLYELNTDPYNHDKCIALSNDVREINWSITEGYKIIIKDNKGGVKLCESEKEFNAWRDSEIAKLKPKWEYLNNLVYKASRDGTVPIYNQKLNENKDNKVVEVYAKEKRVKEGKYAGLTISELIEIGKIETFNKNFNK